MMGDAACSYFSPFVANQLQMGREGGRQLIPRALQACRTPVAGQELQGRAQALSPATEPAGSLLFFPHFTVKDLGSHNPAETFSGGSGSGPSHGGCVLAQGSAETARLSPFLVLSHGMTLL